MFYFLYQSKMFLKSVAEDMNKIENMYRKLKTFFDIATSDNVTHDDIAMVTAMLGDIYAFHHGYPLANKTIQSVLTLGGKTDVSFKHIDTAFVFDLFFLIIDDLADKLILRLTQDVDAQNEDPLVRVFHVMRSSTILRKSHYLLIMACRFNSLDMDEILTHLNHVEGHLKSLFLREFVKNTTVIINAINEFENNQVTIEKELLQSNKSCVRLVETILSINTSQHTLDFAYKTVQQQIMMDEHRVNRALSNVLIISLFVLFSIIIIIVYVFVYKFKIEEVEDMKYYNNLLEEEIIIESNFFQSILADAIPKQLFCYVDIKYDENADLRRIKHSNDLVDDVFQKLSISTSDSYTRRRRRTTSHTSNKRTRNIERRKTHSLHIPPRSSVNSTTLIDPYYQEVTIMMIDIVHFNRLLHYLSASEAVNVVTYLTKLIDDRASYYDVFVASKGTSSYTVISGMYRFLSFIFLKYFMNVF